MLVKVPWLLQKVYPNRLWKKQEKTKRIYLTFDDGPVPEITPFILDLLKKYNSKATFFVVGDNVLKYPEIFRRIIAEGHTVGNHSFCHLNGWKTSAKDYFLDTQKAQIVLEKFLPEYPESGKKKLFRPPYGRLTGKQEKMLLPENYQIIMWDVLSLDYKKTLSGEKCFQNVIKNAGPGSIIVCHDSLKAEENIKFILPKLLEYYHQRDYLLESL